MGVESENVGELMVYLEMGKVFILTKSLCGYTWVFLVFFHFSSAVLAATTLLSHNAHTHKKLTVQGKLLHPLHGAKRYY